MELRLEQAKGIDPKYDFIWVLRFRGGRECSQRTGNGPMRTACARRTGARGLRLVLHRSALRQVGTSHHTDFPGGEIHSHSPTMTKGSTVHRVYGIPVYLETRRPEVLIQVSQRQEYHTRSVLARTSHAPARQVLAVRGTLRLRHDEAFGSDQRNDGILRAREAKHDAGEVRWQRAETHRHIRTLQGCKFNPTRHL